MLTPRNVIALSIGCAVFAIVWSVISLFAAPDSDGRAADTYGTRFRGHRAVFETLKELGVPVRRSLEPPGPDRQSEATLVFWNPQRQLVRLEPAWLAGVGDWVRSGGRVVVATAPKRMSPLELAEFDPNEDQDSDEADDEPGLALSSTTILEHVGAGAVEIVAVDSPEAIARRAAEEGNAPIRPQPFAEFEPEKALRTMIEWRAADEEQVTYAIRKTGSLATLLEGVEKIEVPRGELSAIAATPKEPDGRVFVTDGEGVEHCIAARFAIGSGEVIAVAVPRLISNANLAKADNCIAAARLLVADGREVVFDEFYHGLAIRGNPMWLFSRRTYGTIVLALLLLTGLWVWRHAVFLGPPLKDAPPVRRSVGEYVEAMARFLCESREHGRFIVEQVRDGMLWSLRREHRLPPEKHTLNEVLAILSRRDPARGRQVQEAFALTEAVLESDARIELKRSTEPLQQLTDCLSRSEQRRTVMTQEASKGSE